MATDTKTYNGWTNYETWNVALWIGNEEGLYNYWREATQHHWDESEADNICTRKENATRALADDLKDWTEDQNPLRSQASMWSDLMGAALSEVNWYEIAENWLDDCEEE